MNFLQGQHISFAQQIQQVTDTFQQLLLSMGEETAIDLISNSIFYISIGTNDYIHYYLRNVSSVRSLYTPSSFSHLLSATLKQGIKVNQLLRLTSNYLIFLNPLV